MAAITGGSSGGTTSGVGAGDDAHGSPPPLRYGIADALGLDDTRLVIGALVWSDERIGAVTLVLTGVAG